MENRKGSGIFLGIVSIATLIVAIIGATFAYFSATTQSNLDAVNVSAYEYSLSLTVSPIYPEGASALIPLDPDKVIDGVEGANNTNLLYALNQAEERCIDDQGLQVCTLLQIRISNIAPAEVTLAGQLKTTLNEAGEGIGRTPFQNLTYQEITGDHNQNNLSLVGEAKPVAINVEDEPIDIASITVPGATEGEDGKLEPGVITSYLLVYLNDNGDQSPEMGAKYNGQIIYTSGDEGSNNLTGTFSVSGAQ